MDEHDSFYARLPSGYYDYELLPFPRKQEVAVSNLLEQIIIVEKKFLI